MGAAVAGDTVFGPMLLQRGGYHQEVSFVGNNVGLTWIMDGCAFQDDVDPLLQALWSQVACWQAFK